MDNKTKLVLVILVVIAVVYVIGIGVGSQQDDESHKSEKDKENLKVPEVFKSLRNILPSREAKLKGDDFSNPDFSQTPVAFIVPPHDLLRAVIKESKSDSRAGTFKLVVGDPQVDSIYYQPKALPEGMDSAKARAEIEKPRHFEQKCAGGEERCFKLTIFKAGGIITFTCTGQVPCRIELQ